MVFFRARNALKTVFGRGFASFSHCVNIEGNPQILGSTPSAGPCLPFHRWTGMGLPFHAAGYDFANNAITGGINQNHWRHLKQDNTQHVVLSWALANSRCVPNLKSLAPAVAEIL